MNRLTAALILGFLSLTLIVGSGISGDKEKKTEGKIKGMLPPGWKALDLSAEQKSKVYGIQKAFKAKIAALEEQIIEVRGQEKAEMFKVLTDDQKALLRKLTTGEETPGKKVEKKIKGDEK